MTRFELHQIVERVQEVTKEIPIYREVEGLNPDEQAILF